MGGVSVAVADDRQPAGIGYAPMVLFRGTGAVLTMGSVGPLDNGVSGHRKLVGQLG